MTDRFIKTKSISRPEGDRDSGVPAVELATLHQMFMDKVAGETLAVHGVDFSSAPRRAKPIVVASGQMHLDKRQLRLTELIRLESLEAFEHWLALPAPSVMGFDLPFGLPRELVCELGWPETYEACIKTFASYSRDDLRVTFKAFCDARPVGGKFAHRGTDRPAGSSPSMKWVNPPVAWMLHAGVPRMLACGLTLPGQSAGDPGRLALEAYPGLLARSVSSASYKSDTKAKQTVERLQVRKQIVDAAIQGLTRPGMPIQMSDAQKTTLIEDASGDSLDAVLCLLQAAWGVSRPEADFGLTPGFDRLEGWIVGAGVT
ncbi:MAG: DUF429 domain-containing protein [Burkholderiaceae bacterium]